MVSSVNMEYLVLLTVCGVSGLELLPEPIGDI